MHLKYIFILSFAILSHHINGQSLSGTTPEEVGLSSVRLARIDSLMKKYIEQRKIPGVTMLIARNEKVAYFKSMGYKDLDTKELMTNNTLFRIASMSKAITTVAVMILYEEGHFLLTDPISKFIPEFKQPKVIVGQSESGEPILADAKNEITIRNLLNHTSGITYGDKLQAKYYREAGMTVGFTQTEGTIGEKIKKLAKLPLISNPGEEFHYGMSLDVLGYLVEVISKMPLDEFLRKNIFEPLKMVDTDFNVTPDKLSRLATLYKMDRNGSLTKATGYFPYPEKQTYFSGGAGLVSTAKDYARFAQMILNDGELDGVRILGRKTIEMMTSNSIGDLYIFNPFKHNGIMGDKFGYGFGIRTERGIFDENESIGSFGWDGAFYTRFWIDPTENLFCIFMSQVDNYWDENLIGKFKVLVYQSIID